MTVVPNTNPGTARVVAISAMDEIEISHMFPRDSPFKKLNLLLRAPKGATPVN